MGRLSTVGILGAAALAVGIGLVIPQRVRGHLLHERSETIVSIVDDIIAAGAFDPDLRDDFAALGHLVLLRVLGGDTVRVKLWTEAGEIVWSDEERLIGQRFGLGAHKAEAFTGAVLADIPRLHHPEHIYEQGLGELLEIYVPVWIDASVKYVFEVYQRSGPLTSTVDRTRVTVWTSITLGLGVMAVFMFGVTRAVVVSAERRRSQAEHLLGRLAAARDEERSRLATAIHDDIGQPLYGLLYGLEALDTDAQPQASRSELARLRTLVREIDTSLRDELRRLGDPPLRGRSVAQALAELAGSTDPARPRIDIDTRTSARAAADAEDALYRAVREAIANAQRHSGASSISVTIDAADDRLVATVVDDGHGSHGPPGLGSAVVAKLITLVGGRIETRARPGSGTTVEAWVPTAKEGR
jgi:two-component system, NarL family, sensor kinase